MKKKYFGYVRKKKQSREAYKTLQQTLTQIFSNLVYSGCINKDFEEIYECVTQRWMRIEYDDSVKDWFLFKNGNFMVIIKDRYGADDEGISKKK